MRFLHWAALAGAAALWTTGAVAEDEPQASAAAAKGASFYQQTETADCSGSTCTVRFPKAAAGKVIDTTNLSCLSQANGFEAPPYATFQAGSKIVSYVPLNPYASGGRTVAAGALPGSVFIAKGQVPTVVLAGVVSASCTLSGKLIAK